MTSEELLQIAEASTAEHEQFNFQLNVCMGTGCMSQHSDKVKAALTEEVAKSGKQIGRAHV